MKKSKRPAKVRAVENLPVIGWAVRGANTDRLVPVNEPFPILHKTRTEARLRDWFQRGAVPVTVIEGRIGIDFTITPKARPRNGK